MATLTPADVARLDSSDPLAALRERFALPPGVAYFAGNSLGAPPRHAAARLARAVEEEWGGELVAAWHRWIELPRQLAGRLAPLLGVGEDEVLVADSTTVNLQKLLAALLARGEARRVVVLAGCFPSDLYAAGGLAALAGGELVVAEREELAAALSGATALLVSHVDFRSGELHDLAGLGGLARAHGAALVADLSHSVGAMPLALAEWGVELAVGCTYKFLGGGPGSPAFLVCARRLQPALQSPLRGWLGHADPFAFEVEFRPHTGIARFHCGTPPILAMVALDAALDVFAGVDLAALRAKAEALGELFVTLVEQRLSGSGVTVASPREAHRRGAQVSLRHPRAFALVQGLIARGVVGDFRAPDLLRFGLPPLTLRYADVWRAVEELAALLAHEDVADDRRPRAGEVT
jgi:kynureninase